MVGIIYLILVTITTFGANALEKKTGNTCLTITFYPD